MRPSDHSPRFAATGTALMRAVAHPKLKLPPWPDLTTPAAEHVASWLDWLRQVWAIDTVAEALSHASPGLAVQVRTLCATEEPKVRETRRAVLAVARYLNRMVGRPTPFGLLAGVAPVTFAQQPRLRSGADHRVIARAGAEWLADIIARLENTPALLARLPVVANSTMSVRGDRLIVPYRLKRQAGRGTVAEEVSLRHTAAVRAAVTAARAPIRMEDLTRTLQAEFPATASAQISAMLTELVTRGVLITSLHAPATEPDALGHLLEQLEAADASTAVAPAAGLVDALREIHTLLERHNHAAPQTRAVREEAAGRMRSVARTRRHPLAVDLRLDTTLVLPELVAREAERAASALTRLSSHPYGTRAWKDYHQRFYERYGIGALVPVLDVVADSGIGWPDGYPGAVSEERPAPTAHRDEVLLALAQKAILDGHDEIVVDEALLSALDAGPNPPRTPPHLELCVRVHATGQEALTRGDVELEVVSVSRGAGTTTGRFLAVLDPDARAAHIAELHAVPAGDRETLVAQVSFPPLDPASAHVARAAQSVPLVISLAEHRPPDDQVLTVGDLAVGCDGRRMYLAAPERGHRVEVVGMHALNLRVHTPPLARFLIELGRAQYTQVTMFDWGAATHLPVLPRVRYGRTIVSAARWRLEAAELPRRTASWTAWNDALTSWQIRRRLPRRVHLIDNGRHLPLDLEVIAHRVLLRTHLDTAPHALLVQAPAPQASGWCEGRAHEVIVPLTATAPPRWPRLPAPNPARLVTRDQGQPPAVSHVLLVSLYGDLRRQDLLLTEHMPDLLERLGRPEWWYVRYRDPDQHLRLRIVLPRLTGFGPVTRTVSLWADELHRDGLLREVLYPTSYPETGRWGGGAAMPAAEQVFGADSRAVLAQLRLAERPGPQALVAAHSVAIAAAFTGGLTAGMRWLIDHVPAAAPSPIPRAVFKEAVLIADPREDWAALRAAPGGATVVAAWAPRAHALAVYRTHLLGPDTEGVHPDDVLSSLLHVHFVRAVGIDFPYEAECMYLARAAALAWWGRAFGGIR
ncbi:lantibiotic dehydratase [Streptosporangium sp. NPDC023615]|uniref:lantibiotic dehydratase n=1 Tax=Streptosporangium sp. NPDC023615 TaxID=3154794 RepID=UPI003425C664